MRRPDPFAVHGPQGLILRRLARHALWGWLLFALASLACVLLAVVAIARPSPVIAVDRSGRVLGRIEWLSPQARSRRDLLVAGMRFVRDYFCVNSTTVVADYVQALDMMSASLRQATVAALRKTAYIARVRAAHFRSWVTFRHARLLSRSGAHAQLRLSGVIHLARASGAVRHVSFAVILTVTVSARRPNDTAGIVVDGMRGL